MADSDPVTKKDLVDLGHRPRSGGSAYQFAAPFTATEEATIGAYGMHLRPRDRELSNGAWMSLEERVLNLEARREPEN